MLSRRIEEIQWTGQCQALWSIVSTKVTLTTILKKKTDEDFSQWESMFLAYTRLWVQSPASTARHKNDTGNCFFLFPKFQELQLGQLLHTVGFPISFLQKNFILRPFQGSISTLFHFHELEKGRDLVEWVFMRLCSVWASGFGGTESQENSSMDYRPLLTFLKSGGLKSDGNSGFWFWQSLAVEHESRQLSPSHTL